MSAFYERLERMRPDVVLVDISAWPESLEGLVGAHPWGHRRPHDHRAQQPRAMRTRFWRRCAPASTNICAPRCRRTCAARWKSAPWIAAGGATDPPRKRARHSAFFRPRADAAPPRWLATWRPSLGRQNQKVLLADLDLDAGMIAFITKTKATYSILDAVNNLHRLDLHYWKALVSNGIPGVEIVSAPLALASKQQAKDDQMRHVIGFARPYYDWTLVDLGRSLSHMAMAALEEIDEACLVTTLEVPALHQAKQIIQTLLDSGYGKQRIRLILNRTPKRLDITPGELEKMLGVPIFCMIPNDYPELYEAYAEGRMLGQELRAQEDRFARLANKLASMEEERGAKKRFALFS